jgi:hypothetical protein
MSEEQLPKGKPSTGHTCESSAPGAQRRAKGPGDAYLQPGSGIMLGVQLSSKALA